MSGKTRVIHVQYKERTVNSKAEAEQIQKELQEKLADSVVLVSSEMVNVAVIDLLFDASKPPTA